MEEALGLTSVKTNKQVNKQKNIHDNIDLFFYIIGLVCVMCQFVAYGSYSHVAVIVMSCYVAV